MTAVAAGSALAAASCSRAESAAAPSTPPAAAAAPPPPPEKKDESFFSFVPDPVRAPFHYVYDSVYENVVAPYAEPSRPELLPDVPSQIKGREKPTLVVALDGLLIESQWTRQFGWRYIKRPGVDEFLTQLAPLYELVLWTECLNSAETVVEKLDARRLFRHKLYRDATTYAGGTHRKDLSALNRDLNKVLIVDTSPEAYSYHPQYGISVTP